MMRTNQTKSVRSGFVRGLAIFAAVCGVGIWADTAQGAGALAHWTFDAISGPDKNIFTDATGNRPAKIAETGKVVMYEGVAPFGGAAMFNGEQGAYLTTKTLPIHATSFSVAAWVNLSKVDASFVITDWESGAKSAYVFGVDPVIFNPHDKNYLIADMSGSFVPTTGCNRNRRAIERYPMQNDVPINEWHHLAWVWDRTNATSGTLHVYLDGKGIGDNPSVPLPEPPATPPNNNTTVNIADNKVDIRIGGRALGNVPFHGAMDELWVFTEALQQDQIKNLMAYNNLAGTGGMAKMLTKDKDGAIVFASAAPPEQKPEVKPVEVKPEPKPAEAVAVQTPPTTPTPAVTPTPATPTPANDVAANVTPTTPTQVMPAVEPKPTPPPTENRTTAAVTPDRTERVQPKPDETPRMADRAPDRTATGDSTNTTRSVPVTPRSMGKDVVIASVPQGYSPMRLTGIVTCATIALFLAGFLVWALGERAKMAVNR